VIEGEIIDLEKPKQSRNIDLLGLPITPRGLQIPDDLDYAATGQRSFLATFLNPYSYYLASKHPGFAESLGAFDHISCDGIGLVIAAKLCLRKSVPRQAFDTTSVALPVFRWATEKSMPLILVGGEPGIADSAGEILKQLVPGLTIAGTYPGFNSGPEQAKQLAMQLGDSLVVCGMGAPLQEEFLCSLRDTTWRGIGFTCGGFLDQLVVKVDYYPRWINRMNLRFIYRLYKEPARLWRRYLIEYQVFVGRFLKAIFTR